MRVQPVNVKQFFVEYGFEAPDDVQDEDLQSLYDATGDAYLKFYTDVELQCLPPLGKDFRSFLERSRLFRAGNPLLNKITKKMMVDYIGSDSTALKFPVVSGRILHVGCGKLGSTSDFNLNGPVDYADPLFNGKKFQDFQDVRGYDAVVSDVAIPDEKNLGMGIHAELQAWAQRCVSQGVRVVIKTDVYDNSFPLVKKPRKHNLEVIADSHPTETIRVSIDELLAVNDRRNRMHKYGVGYDPPPFDFDKLHGAYQRGTLKRQLKALSVKNYVYCDTADWADCSFSKDVFEYLIDTKALVSCDQVPTDLYARRRSLKSESELKELVLKWSSKVDARIVYSWYLRIGLERNLLNGVPHFYHLF